MLRFSHIFCAFSDIFLILVFLLFYSLFHVTDLKLFSLFFVDHFHNNYSFICILSQASLILSFFDLLNSELSYILLAVFVRMAECYKDAETHLVPADDLSLHVNPPAHGSGLDSAPLTCRHSQVTSYWLSTCYNNNSHQQTSW